MPLFLVRHSHAGSRSDWKGADDAERPLSPKGEAQSRYIAERLADRPIRRLYSSPATRCIQTLEPLATSLDLEIRETPRLGEGADPDEAVAYLLRHAKHDAAFASHGDLIPKVIRRLVTAGMRTTQPSISAKGSWWELEVDHDAVTHGTYVPQGTA